MKMPKNLFPIILSLTLFGCSSSDNPEVTSEPASNTTTPVTMKDDDKETPVTMKDDDKETPAKPAASTLSLTFTPTKAFSFTWVAVTGATSYQLTEAVTDGSGYELVKEVTATSTSFNHIVPLYARLNAKYILQSCNAGGCTASAPVLTMPVVADMTSSIGYFKAGNTGEDDQFGTSVSVSKDGNTLAVGAKNEDSNSKEINNVGEDAEGVVSTGAVYVFTRSGAMWSQQAYIKASNADIDDAFGSSVSLSADGNTLAVGATHEDGGTDTETGTGTGTGTETGTQTNSGAVYVYTRTNNVWSNERYLKADNAGAEDIFGHAVSLSDDGHTLVVGAQYEDGDKDATGVVGSGDNESKAGAGAAYVFVRSDDNWGQQAYVKAGNAGISDWFGHSVSLSGDGHILAVSSRLEDSDQMGVVGIADNDDATHAGAVYVFARISDGTNTTWTEQAYIKASNAEAGDIFGASVSLDFDGNTLAVSAPGEDSNAINSGAVYVFIRTGQAWSEEAYLKANNTGENDNFGHSVSISADGNTLAVGAKDEGSNAVGIDNEGPISNGALKYGAVYTFTRSGTAWPQQAYIKARNTGEDDEFGYSVALSGDGGTLAVSAIKEDSNAKGVNSDQTDGGASNSGAVYVY